MDAAIQQGLPLDLNNKIKSITNLCRISNIEKLLSDCLERLPDKTPLDYVGELNKNDIMH